MQAATSLCLLLSTSCRSLNTSIIGNTEKGHANCSSFAVVVDDDGGGGVCVDVGVGVDVVVYGDGGGDDDDHNNVFSCSLFVVCVF